MAMGEDMDEADWERLKGAFLRPASAPSRAETAAFAARVMGRLEEEDAPWLALRWLAPALAFAAAALALSFTPGAREDDDAVLVAAAPPAVVAPAAALDPGEER